MGVGELEKAWGVAVRRQPAVSVGRNMRLENKGSRGEGGVDAVGRAILRNQFKCGLLILIKGERIGAFILFIERIKPSPCQIHFSHALKRRK